MLAEVEAARSFGCAGVAVGALRPDGRLDTQALGALVQAAKGMEVTLHRCFDLAPDPFEAMEQAVALGIHRILTSGGGRRALDALDLLAALHGQAARRIVIMPGGGLTPANLGALMAAAPFAEVHASCSDAVAQDSRTVAMGFAAPIRREARAGQVRDLRSALDAAGSGSA